jgi:hypothetical protein
MPYCHLLAVSEKKTRCLTLAGRENRSIVEMLDATVEATSFDDIGRTLDVRPHMPNCKKYENYIANQKILISWIQMAVNNLLLVIE